MAAIQVDGQMIDYPIVYRAQALLDAMPKSGEMNAVLLAGGLWMPAMAIGASRRPARPARLLDTRVPLFRARVARG